MNTPKQLPLFAFALGDPLPVGAVFLSRQHRHYDLILPVWTVVEIRYGIDSSGNGKLAATLGYLAQALPLGCYGELLSYHSHSGIIDTGLRFSIPCDDELDTWFHAAGRVSWRIDAWNLTRDGSIATVHEREGGGTLVRRREDGLLYVRYPPLPQEADLVAGLAALGVPWQPGQITVSKWPWDSPLVDCFHVQHEEVGTP